MPNYLDDLTENFLPISLTDIMGPTKTVCHNCGKVLFFTNRSIIGVKGPPTDRRALVLCQECRKPKNIVNIRAEKGFVAAIPKEQWKSARKWKKSDCIDVVIKEDWDALYRALKKEAGHGI